MYLLISFIGVLTVSHSAHALVQNNSVGRLPALGWNSWNAFGCDVDETKILAAANLMVTLGFKDAGYEYVNIDDCWSLKSGRAGDSNSLAADPSKFPNGIITTANAIHALGLKIGIYSDAGSETCAGYPGSLGFESLDASTFAAWGIDYLKYDNCNVPSDWGDTYLGCVPEPRDYGGIGGLSPNDNCPESTDWADTYQGCPPHPKTGYGGPFPNGTCPDAYYDSNHPAAPPGYDWSTSNTAKRYNTMRDALSAGNRTILFSLCDWGQADVWDWGNQTGNSWRMSGDIGPSWDRIVYIMNENSALLDHVDFWGHNDADMLEVGNGGLTLEENRSHFALWAAMKSPLIIGTALDQLSTDLVGVLKNKYLLAFNQDDVFGSPAKQCDPNWVWDPTSPPKYWSGASQDGTLVLIFNPTGADAEMGIAWVKVPQLANNGDAFQVTEIWAGVDLGCIPFGWNGTVAAHDTAGFLVGKACSWNSSTPAG